MSANHLRLLMLLANFAVWIVLIYVAELLWSLM